MKTNKARQLISQHYDLLYVNDKLASFHSHGERKRQLQRPNTAFLELDDESLSFSDTDLEQFEPDEKSGFLSMKEPKHVEEVQVAIRDELACWGIDEGESENHAKFAKKAYRAAIASFRGASRHYWSPPDTSLDVPRDLSDGIRFLLDFFIHRLTDGGQNKTLKLPRERFGVHHPNAPFYDKNEEPLLRMSYFGTNFDPLTRFIQKDEDVEAAITSLWKASPPCHIVEAATIHQLIHGDCRCISCDAHMAFQLNSKLSISFADIICGSCGSIYSIQAISSSDSIFELFKRGHFRTDRPYALFRQEKLHLANSSNMYFVLVSMEDMSQLQAYVAKITEALPSLSSKSFDFKNHSSI